MTLRRSAPTLIALALVAGGSGLAVAQQQATAPAAAPQATASKHNSNAPIDWDADRIEVQDRQHRATLTGSVRVVQQEMTLTADRVTANYTGSVASSGPATPTPAKPGAAKPASGGNSGGPQVHRLDATGNVVVTRPSEIAHGQYGIYDLDKRLVTLIGGVTLDRNGNVVRGGRLVIDLNTDHANMDGSAVGGSGSAGTGGRVSGRFTVPQHDNSQNSGGTTPAKTSTKPATPATAPTQH